MNHRSQFQAFLIAALATLLAACASLPSPTVSREGARSAAPGAGQAGTTTQPLPEEADVPQAQIRRGSGQTINRAVAASPPPNLAGTSGEATFNFEGESLPAVVKAILGDMLGQNYVIAPGVQGTVTLATPKPVSPAQALSLLEMVLGWNNARMIYSDGRYNIVPADGAMATGAVAPRTGSAVSARGFESRVVPLKYISATEMEKILKPYARPGAVVNVDPGRNVITVAGSRTELENYLRTIRIFDVDWMSSMSVGVFPLQNSKATDVVENLEKVFGEQSKSPVAGMFRFMPLEGANAVLVITTQPDYLDQIRQWLERIDGAGAGVRLFSYELKYIKAGELAQRLAEVFGGSGGTGRDTGGRGGVSLMPGTTPGGIGDDGFGGRDGFDDGGMGTGGMNGTGTGGLGEGTLQLDPREQGPSSVTLEVEGDKVGVSAVDETNTLLVRTTGTAWKSIRDVIERLDVMPMQVHIEAQIAEVTLTGELSYGVNWYFENAVSDPVTSGGAGLPNADGRGIWGDISGSILTSGLSWTFLGRNAAAVITALDQVTDVQILQSPSVLVRNNAEATFNVGSRIPINSVSFDPSTGTEGTFSQVQYIETGTILKVRPRVTKDGMVFLDIVQEVSTPGLESTADENGNVRIDTRKLKTEAAVQSGDTVMLAGLIKDEIGHGSDGIPGLSRIPIIGGLFGQQRSSTGRSEVIILLTPRIIRNPQDARDLTDEYSRRFRAMQPLTPKRDE